MSTSEECCICLEYLLAEEDKWRCWQCEKYIHVNCEIQLARWNMNYCPSCRATKRSSAQIPTHSDSGEQSNDGNEVNADVEQDFEAVNPMRVLEKRVRIAFLFIMFVFWSWVIGVDVLSSSPSKADSNIDIFRYVKWSFIQRLKPDNHIVITLVGMGWFVYISMYVLYVYWVYSWVRHTCR